MKPSETKVLVVDDDKRICAFVCKMLNSAGYTSHQAAENGQRGIEQAAAYLPHFVLMDTNMPGIDGYEACRQLRETEYGQKMAIVGMSIWDDKGRKKARWLAAGADAFINKEELEKSLLVQVIEETVPKYQG
jgi:putative two-component system response regulator